MSKVNAPGQGRKSAYKPEYDLIVTNASNLGMTPSELAMLLGITVRTYYNWTHAYPSFLNAYQLGKVNADKRVMMTLYDHCILGSTKTVSKVVTNLKTGDIVETVETVKNPPNAASLHYWLANRIPDEWHLGRLKPIDVIPEEDNPNHDITITVIDKTDTE